MSHFLRICLEFPVGAHLVIAFDLRSKLRFLLLSPLAHSVFRGNVAACRSHTPGAPRTVLAIFFSEVSLDRCLESRCSDCGWLSIAARSHPRRLRFSAESP